MSSRQRIGLVRHLPVTEALPAGWLTSAGLQAWRARYEAAPLAPFAPPSPLLGWGRCYSSDLPRALATAQVLFPGAVLPTPLLREADFLPFPTGRLRLPVRVWRWLLQAAWLTGHSSQRAVRDAFLERIREMAGIAEATGEDVLLVSHAGTMLFLSRELRSRGFHGPGFTVAEHARLYVFTREARAAGAPQSTQMPR